MNTQRANKWPFIRRPTQRALKEARKAAITERDATGKPRLFELHSFVTSLVVVGDNPVTNQKLYRSMLGDLSISTDRITGDLFITFTPRKQGIRESKPFTLAFDTTSRYQKTDMFHNRSSVLLYVFNSELGTHKTLAFSFSNADRLNDFCDILTNRYKVMLEDEDSDVDEYGDEFRAIGRADENDVTCETRPTAHPFAPQYNFSGDDEAVVEDETSPFNIGPAQSTLNEERNKACDEFFEQHKERKKAEMEAQGLEYHSDDDALTEEEKQQAEVITGAPLSGFIGVSTTDQPPVDNVKRGPIAHSRRDTIGESTVNINERHRHLAQAVPHVCTWVFPIDRQIRHFGVNHRKPAKEFLTLFQRDIFAGRRTHWRFLVRTPVALRVRGESDIIAPTAQRNVQTFQRRPSTTEYRRYRDEDTPGWYP